MRQMVQYRIDTDYPRETGLPYKTYSVIGTWTENGSRFTNGSHCYYGCRTFREARRVLRELVKTTVESVIEDCVYSLFRALNADCEYSESRDNFAEECKENDWTFTADGLMINA